MTKPPSQSNLIKDIPSIRKNLETARNLKRLKIFMPLLRPFLTLMGIEVEELNQSLLSLDELEQAAKDLATIPDRFNDLFSERGWIIYEQMNIEVAKTAIRIAEEGDLGAAEQVLVDYYTPETVKWLLRTMNGVQSFQKRIRLAELAWIDYQEGRYHACIPVVLAQLDGLVNDLHQPKKGFFSTGVNLEAWDSIAAHSKGLQVLSILLGKGRDRTRVETITIPYRNGILHGTDLGYDNQIVAAKTWAALFAVREWAIKAERGQLTPPSERPNESIAEILERIREVEEDKKRLNSWQPRELQIGIDVPTTGEPKDYGETTPERSLVEYLTWLKQRNYGYMAQYLPQEWLYSANEAPARIREHFSTKQLKSYEITAITDETPFVTIIEVKINYEVSGQEVVKKSVIHMKNEDTKGDLAISGKPGSHWVVLSWTIP